MTLRAEILRPVTDPAFLGAKIRALRSRILTGAELAKLASLSSPIALYSRMLGGEKEVNPVEAQRALIARYVKHLIHILNFTGGAQYALFEWLVRRYQIENLKVIIRAWLRKLPLAEVERDLLPLPKQFALPSEKMLAAPDVAALVELIPAQEIAKFLGQVTHRFLLEPKAFYLEAAIDKAYYLRALELAEALGGLDREQCVRIIKTEIMCYNVIFVLRCMQVYELSKEAFIDLIIEHGHFTSKSYIDTLIASPVERLLETVPSLKPVNPAGRPVTSVADLEEILSRYLHKVVLAQYVASALDFGVVVAYCYLKYFELRDILRLGEAIRLGLPAAEARKRLITAGEENV